MKSKIYTMDELDKELKNIKKDKKKIVLTHGVFDLLHIGHIKYFKKAFKVRNLIIYWVFIIY